MLGNFIGIGKGYMGVWLAHTGFGLPLAISIGGENFRRFLSGARRMDEHFRDAPYAENMPVILGLLGVLYRRRQQIGPRDLPAGVALIQVVHTRDDAGDVRRQRAVARAVTQPGIVARRVDRHLVSAVLDLGPTLYDIAGISAASDGRSPCSHGHRTAASSGPAVKNSQR